MLPVFPPTFIPMSYVLPSPGAPAVSPASGDAFAPLLPLALLYALNLGGFQLVAALPTLIGLSPTGFSIAFRLLVACLAVWVVAGWLLKPRPVYAGLAWFPVGCLFFLLLLRIGVDAAWQPAILPLSPAEYLLWTVGVCLVPMVAMFEKPSRSTLLVAWWLSLIVASAAAGILVLLAATGSLAAIWVNRLSTEVINPILVGQLGAALLLLAIAPPKRLTELGPRYAMGLLLLLVAALGLGLVVASGSRGPLLGVLLSAAMVFLLPTRNTATYRSLLRIGSFLIVLVGLAIAYFATRDSFELQAIERLFYILGDSSTSYRWLAMAGALEQFAQNPWFGSSLVELQTTDYPHNIVVESLMALGIFGFLSLMGIVGVGLFSAFVIFRELAPARWVAAIYILMLATAQTSGALYLSYGFWCFSAAVISIAAARVCRFRLS